MELTTEQRLAEAIKRAEAAEAALKASKAPKGSPTIKVSSKGGLSVYGLGRWPVTLYASQWRTLLNASEDIKKALEINAE